MKISKVMKNRIYIILGIIAIVLASCNLSNSSSNTPQIYFVTNPIVNKGDTLYRYPTDESGVSRMDTIHVGDTVTFRMLYWGYSNNLTSCNVISSDTSATKIIFPTVNSLDSIFLSTQSDYSIGKFVFKSKISSLYFPFKYIAKKVSNDAKITFSLSSDANFDNSASLGNNSVSFVLKTPVKLRTTPALVQ